MVGWGGGRTYLAGGDYPFRDGREVDETLTDLGVAGDVWVEGDADSAVARLALARSSTLLGGVDDLEVLLVDGGHQHLVRLERLQKIAVVRREIRQRVLPDKHQRGEMDSVVSAVNQSSAWRWKRARAHLVVIVHVRDDAVCLGSNIVGSSSGGHFV